MLRNDVIWLKANFACGMLRCRYEASQADTGGTYMFRVYTLNSLQRLIDRQGTHGTELTVDVGWMTRRPFHPLPVVKGPWWSFEARKFQFYAAVPSYRDILDCVCDDNVKKRQRRHISFFGMLAFSRRYIRWRRKSHCTQTYAMLHLVNISFQTARRAIYVRYSTYLCTAVVYWQVK